MIVEITDHVERASGRLIQQYKDNEEVKGIVKAFTSGIQDLETVCFQLLNNRWVDSAEGQQLDDFGTIVGQDREGYNDDFYRILIYLKIAENISEGEASAIVDAFKIVSQATLGFIEENFPAGMTLMSNGLIDDDKIQFIYRRLQKIAGAGIRVDFIGYFDKDKPFAFEGFPNAAPFDDGSNDPNSGVFSFTYKARGDFAFEDGSDETEGFGTSDDHALGGYWVTE